MKKLLRWIVKQFKLLKWRWDCIWIRRKQTNIPARIQRQVPHPNGIPVSILDATNAKEYSHNDIYIVRNPKNGVIVMDHGDWVSIKSRNSGKEIIKPDIQ